MAEGEATQEPTAPEGAPASPPAEDASAPNGPPPQEESAAPEAEARAESSAPDWSHVLGFQSVQAAPEALASRPDYAEELTKELAVRAARFARSVDESIVLSSDGLMRWLGDPVARLAAGEGLLQPRAILLADEALAGEDRAAVENRLALWLAAHVRKVLGPLLALAEGADLPDAARALAAKVAEALGVLERDRVRDDVRALDQTARGALRKLGVRFGSLYIYVPALLKPGPRGLCSLLWTLKRGPEAGSERLLAFAASGRTSFANEGLVSPDAYRVAGFRLCGERVVRVDIIERLSDLIRAAIPDHMRAGSRPATPTYGFLVSPQMTSLTGCAGDAFATILRSLGFEPVKVSKAAFEAARATAPTEPLKPAAGEAVPPAGEAEPAGSAPEGGEDVELTGASPPGGEAAPEGGEAEPVAAAPEGGEAPAPEAEVAAGAEEEPTAEVPEPAAQTTGDEAQAVAPLPEAGGDIAAAEPAPDEEIEIWRPAPRRPRAARPAQGGEREGAAPRFKPHRRHGRPAEAAAQAGEAREQAPQRQPHAQKRDEAPRRFEGKPENREDRRPHKGFGPRREQRPTQVDPDSPFAKLAALKPLLERRDKRP
jgi:ATP-dependent RNA helicase SUPV3L1/SUV3